MLVKRLIGLLILVLGTFLRVYASEKTTQTQQSFSFQTDYYQIKDGFNYGLVTNGMNLVFGFDRLKVKQDNMISYSSNLAFGLGHRQGIALNLHLKPADFFYGIRIKNAFSEAFFLGGYTALNYHWQLYPELQSGHMLWFSSLEIGPRIHAKFNIGKRQLNVIASNSLAGFSSRPEPITEQYFYSLKFSDFAGNPHSNIKFGSFDLMNHSHAEIELPNNKGSRITLAYMFDYFAYYKNPKVEYLTHSIKLSWKLGKKGNKS